MLSDADHLAAPLSLPSRLRTITLHALSASIPHLFLLLHSLLAILPFPPADVHHAITTSSVKLTDELVPDDEEEPIVLGERWCSAVEIVIRVGGSSRGDGDDAEGPRTKKVRRKKRGKGKGPGVGVEASAEGAGTEASATAARSPPTAPAAPVEYDDDDEMAAMNG